jgi:cardiolipin hydrolase
LTMDEIILHLEQSIADEQFSTSEKKTLKAFVAVRQLDQDQLNFLRSKVYELANTKVTDTNYRFIIEWIRMVSNALVARSIEKSDAFFSPGESCRDVIIRQISQAVKRIHICVFTISDDRISEAIMTSHRKGLEIKIITDNDKSGDLGSDIDRFAKEGIAVKMDSTPNHMHHKFMVVDDRSLLTGSYNWTLSAARYNHENIVLTQEGGVVKSFLKEFERLWNEMNLYQG